MYARFSLLKQNWLVQITCLHAVLTYVFEPQLLNRSVFCLPIFVDEVYFSWKSVTAGTLGKNSSEMTNRLAMPSRLKRRDGQVEV